MNNRYKKAIMMILVIISSFMLSSQAKSPYYTRSVIITRVYPHKLGYKVLYMTNELKNKSIYLPKTIFSDSNDGSDIILGLDKSYPYMQIFWKNGEFSHVKLFLKSDFNDITWGSFNNPDSHDDNFNNADLKFDF